MVRASKVAALAALPLACLAASAVLPPVAGPAQAALQPPSAQPPAAGRGAAGRGGAAAAPSRKDLAGTAATRAIALCSGLWSGNQTRAMIDRDNPGAADMPTVVDEARKIVSITYADNMPPRIVVWRPVLGCTQLPIGATTDAIQYLPQVRANVRTPNFDNQPWPTGDQNARGTLPAAQQAALDALVEKAFDGTTYSGRTWGVIVVKDGKIVAERYAMGFDMHMGAQTHSAAKSFAASVVGVAVKDFGFDVKRAPALEEWRAPGDPRGAISVEHLLQMRSGLCGDQSNCSPQQDIYSGGFTVAGRVATNQLDTRPGTRFLYNPPDTMALVRSVRQTVKDDQTFWALPFERLFWKIGMTRTTPSSDWNGDFLMSGQSYSTARDFARFGLLYLGKGMWNGERVLPQGWAEYVATPGPVQPAGTGPRYGAQFWLHGGQSGLPADAFTPNGGQGQFAMIIPSRGVVVVRRGYDAGGGFQIARFSADVLKVFE